MPKSKKKTPAPRPHLSGKPPAARLYFFWMPGCRHCAKGKEYIAEFERGHRSDLSVIRINAQLRPKVGDFEPAGVPAYLLCIGEREVMQHEGLLDVGEMEDLLQQGREEYEKPESDDSDEEEEDEPDEEDEEDDSDDEDGESEHDVVDLVGEPAAESDPDKEEEEDIEEEDEDLGDASPEKDESDASVEEESKEMLTPLAVKPEPKKGKK